MSLPCHPFSGQSLCRLQDIMMLTSGQDLEYGSSGLVVERIATSMVPQTYIYRSAAPASISAQAIANSSFFARNRTAQTDAVHFV
jgi:hypothetical protein